jgi:hypothetical protein
MRVSESPALTPAPKEVHEVHRVHANRQLLGRKAHGNALHDTVDQYF